MKTSLIFMKFIFDYGYFFFVYAGKNLFVISSLFILNKQTS